MACQCRSLREWCGSAWSTRGRRPSRRSRSAHSGSASSRITVRGVSEALSIADLMHKPAVVVSPELTLSEASRVLDDHKVGAAAVLDTSGAIVGMVSERDLLRSVGHGVDPGKA